MTSPTTGEQRIIPLANLQPSPFNPRKTFDQAKLDELTESIRTHGVLQPILVRPNGAPDQFEIVAGERRYRAATAASLETIPATIRELTDAQALELQVIENLQRDDLHELEEAEGYERLMQCRHADGATYSAEEIAAKVGKSKAYIYARLKLTELCEAGREALRKGDIPASTALLIARIPVVALQEKCLGEILDGEYGDDPMSYRDAKEHIEQRYMLRLKEAPFKADDEDLVPAAGACTACPKRTGNHPELFADIASADVCTDPDCFEAKRAAAIEIKRAKAKDSGKPVITGAKAKKLWKWEYSNPTGYVKLDDRCPGDPKGRHWRAVLGKAAADHTLIEHPSKPGNFAAVMAIEQIDKKLLEGLQARMAPAADGAKDREARELQDAVASRAYLALRAHVILHGLDAEAIRAIIGSAIDWSELDDYILGLWGFTAEQIENHDTNLDEVVKSAEPKALLGMLLDVTVHSSYGGREYWPALAKARGIDVKTIEREVKAERKAAKKAAPAEVE